MRRPGFRRFFAARTVSQWGDTFNAVALVILVYKITGSGLRVGGVVAFEVAPVIVFGLTAGALVDRFPLRRVMITADLGRAALAIALVISHDTLAVVYAIAFGSSALTVFFNPAASAAVPALVAEENIVGANSALWSGAVLSQIVLAPAAGGLIALVGVGAAFGINAASFLASALLLTGLPVPKRRTGSAGRHFQDVLDGLRAIRKRPLPPNARDRASARSVGQ